MEAPAEPASAAAAPPPQAAPRAKAKQKTPEQKAALDEAFTSAITCTDAFVTRLIDNRLLLRLCPRAGTPAGYEARCIEAQRGTLLRLPALTAQFHAHAT